MTVTSWQDLRAKNTTFGRLIPGLGFVVVGEEEAVGVKLPDVNASPGVVVEPDKGCKYTLMWLA